MEKLLLANQMMLHETKQVQLISHPSILWFF